MGETPDPTKCGNVLVGSQPTFASLLKNNHPKKDLEKGQHFIASKVVVFKFSTQRPSLSLIRNAIQKDWNIEGDFTLGLLDPRHVLASFETETETEILKALAKYNCQVMGTRFKTFRWHTGFSLKQDPAMAPVWVDLLKLPLEFFYPSLLKSIGNGLGSFVSIDRDTAFLARPDVAREPSNNNDIHNKAIASETQQNVNILIPPPVTSGMPIQLSNSFAMLNEHDNDLEETENNSSLEEPSTLKSLLNTTPLNPRVASDQTISDQAISLLTTNTPFVQHTEQAETSQDAQVTNSSPVTSDSQRPNKKKGFLAFGFLDKYTSPPKSTSKQQPEYMDDCLKELSTSRSDTQEM
ncbi:hypothetical protein FRX31_025860 [Thalictrum thalictroides]|uniref:DUF4283 domain-containing protein n=1 Tax=Thalictrum thalictroides TaxID=46969 RepID=A0A7J6VJS2_THATH|nr:hypothetical protein FRX31_025860 [Thalictrum thalictroides]